MLEKHSINNWDKINIRKIEEFINKRDKVAEENGDLINKIQGLQALYDKSRKELSQMKRNELNRIGREFLLNDYERRYKVSQNIIISAITGEDNTSTELARQNREQKV
jgi:hypothetical protein